MVKLTSIWLAGWKSIRVTDPPIQLNNLNILIGSNGAGKSNLIAYFQMLHAMIGGRLQEFIAKSGGADALLHFGIKRTDCIASKILFDSNVCVSRYYQRLIPVSPAGLVFTEERFEFTKPGEEDISPSTISVSEHYETVLTDEFFVADENEIPVSLLMSRCVPFHLLDTSETAAVRRPCYIEANRQLAPDAGNLAAMLYLYKQTHPVVYRRILNAVQLVAPYITERCMEK